MSQATRRMREARDLAKLIRYAPRSIVKGPHLDKLTGQAIFSVGYTVRYPNGHGYSVRSGFTACGLPEDSRANIVRYLEGKCWQQLQRSARNRLPTPVRP